MRKNIVMLLIISLLLIGCYTAYRGPITPGIYKTQEDETYDLGGQIKIEEITVIMTEISKDDFIGANNINVIEDLYLSVNNRKYYSLELQIKEMDADGQICEVLYKESSKGGAAPNTYYFTVTYLKNDEELTFDLQLTLYSRENQLSLSMDTENGHINPTLKLQP